MSEFQRARNAVGRDDPAPHATIVHGATRGARRNLRLASSAAAICVLPLLSLGCDRMLTVRPAPGTRFDQPLEGLDNGELGRFQRGDVQFQRGFAINEGLGPVFNNRSCASCHSGDGRGSPANALVRFSRGADPALDVGGPQLQDHAIPGAEPEGLPAGVDVSRRLPPPAFGIGLIEGIPDSAILAHADPTDADADGISGRANMVTPPAWVPADEPGGGAGPRVGRFSRKAQVSSAFQQVVEAYHQDMGITSPARASENANPLATQPAVDPARDPEVGEGEVQAVMDYVRMLAPPAPAAWTDRLRHGEALFASTRCAACHVPTMPTGPNEIMALAHRNATLYSDLLIHDLGDALADGRPDGAADGREWRTAPLWGMRIVREFLKGRLFLLHDGRAGTVAEAIGLHGGEAAASRDAYLALPPDDRAALVEFVESR